MGWSDFVGRAFTRDTFATYLASLKWTTWKPKGCVVHNTAAPTLAQWAESGPNHLARIRNLKNYYQNEKHWHGAPHFFISRDWINVFDGLTEPGVHSPSFNPTHFGIEMVGNFDREAFNSGDGLKVRDNTVFVLAQLCRRHNFNPDKDIKFHKEDPRTTHDCPGKFVHKGVLIQRVKAEIARQEGKPVVEVPDKVDGEASPPPTWKPPDHDAFKDDVVNPVVPVTSGQRRRMAKAIIDFEARRDSQGRLAVYRLPAGDMGGTYEVAGINDGYHKTQVDKLVTLIHAGKHKEAEESVITYLVAYTNVAAGWTKNAGVEFFLRDSVFHRGPTGAAHILQRAVGVRDTGVVDAATLAAMAALSTPVLLQKLRAAREQYERDAMHRNESSKFWRGLVNRWNNSLKQATVFSEEKVGGGVRAAVGTGVAVSGGAGAIAVGNQIKNDGLGIGSVVLISTLMIATAIGVYFLVKWLRGP